MKSFKEWIEDGVAPPDLYNSTVWPVPMELFEV